MQVKVPESDRGALHVLWWDSEDLTGEPKRLQMTSYSFGATKTISDSGLNCMTEVKQSVDIYIYVDDCLASLPDVSLAQRFVRELSRVLSKGAFHLRRWICNRESLLSEVCESDVSPSELSIEAFQAVERTLGLQWDAKADEFPFNFVFPGRPLTRRGILLRSPPCVIPWV
ncbi:hypothetical protein X801_07812 [Opisthorchis viverrini]|uniref:Reverse transcriptase domain-containing protein n=1 Tax=Opisthorchis viverrini TaxID=6198 RepID=A0A1S8WPM6_OPIVI|nr:hypothetical protein X801_07812 [Opisthorchis viverrini]